MFSKYKYSRQENYHATVCHVDKKIFYHATVCHVDWKIINFFILLIIIYYFLMKLVRLVKKQVTWYKHDNFPVDMTYCSMIEDFPVDMT
jgi:hypothetical protein